MNPESLEARVTRLEEHIKNLDRSFAEGSDRRHDLEDRFQESLEDFALARERMGVAIKRTSECLTEIRDFRKEVADEKKEQALERKSDRRWLVGTILSSAVVIIAALALFFG